ncbi:hypothetical protein SynBIOSE41_04331 [Synechococcus sp. BIOS-E4-1]|nr:hypothetical protein SynBIOSE41_04331 [Synechococcus sp. BIOS-E4-1]
MSLGWMPSFCSNPGSDRPANAAGIQKTIAHLLAYVIWVGQN